MAGEKRRDCETRGRQSTDAPTMRDVHPWIFLRWKAKQCSQVFSNNKTEDILDFFSLANFLLFFFLVALANCHEMGLSYQAPIMAVTRFINAHRVITFFFHCIVFCLTLYSHDLYYSSNARNPGFWKARNHTDWPIPFQFITSIDGGRQAPKSVLLRRGLLAWSKHGHMCLAAPDFEPAFDISVCMDVARNPGPDIETPKPLLPTVNLSEPPSLPEHVCGTLFKLRGPSKTTFRTSILGELKNAGLLRYWGKRGGWVES